MIRRSIFAISPLVLACALATDASAAQRVFVASNGADTNPCTLSSPCRSFAHAMTQVDSGGEIVALNAAGYGTVTIEKSVTITTNSGYFAGIAASEGSAIFIISPGLNVVLRGLALNGTGATTGIHMADSGTLTVENCIVSGFTENGIQVTVPATARITDTIVRGNGGHGISASGGSTVTLNNVKMSRNEGAGFAVSATGTNTVASIYNSDASYNGTGFLSNSTGAGLARLAILRSSASHNSGAAVRVSGINAAAAVSFSHLSGNTVAMENDGGLLETFMTNVARFNGTLSSGVITSAAGQ